MYVFFFYSVHRRLQLAAKTYSGYARVRSKLRVQRCVLGVRTPLKFIFVSELVNCNISKLKQNQIKSILLLKHVLELNSVYVTCSPYAGIRVLQRVFETCQRRVTVRRSVV